MATSKAPIKLLAIDGGGVRGLLALLMLEHIMGRVNHFRTQMGWDVQLPWQLSDMIAGINTGGLVSRLRILSLIAIVMLTPFSLIAILLGKLRLSIGDATERYMLLSKETFTLEKLAYDDPKPYKGSKIKIMPVKTALSTMLGDTCAEFARQRGQICRGRQCVSKLLRPGNRAWTVSR